ncbi:MAG: hypothetical protein P8129_20885 [Anaerolineae bacterium]
MTRRPVSLAHSLWAVIVLAAASLAAAHALGGSWAWAAAGLGLGALWLLGLWRNWAPTASLGLAAFTALAALNLWLDGRSSIALLALLAVVAALCAWDLDGLARRLARYPFVGDRASLERRHLARLLAVAALGLLLGGAALAIQIRLTFLPALLLGLLALLGLSWAVLLLRSANG